MKDGWVLDEKLDVELKKRGAQDKNIEEGPIFDTKEKVLCLMSAYLCKMKFESFSLVSDTQYVV
jgi:hypothetical protein